MPPNCLAPGCEHYGHATIAFCERCYAELSATEPMTAAERAVIEAAVKRFSGLPVREGLLAAIAERRAVVALLAAQPEWRK